MVSRPILLSFGRQAEVERLVQLFDDSILLERVDSLEKLPDAIRAAKPDVVLCAWSCPWSRVIAVAHEVSPGLPVIVVSAYGGGREWYQVLAAGGFDLLTPPHHPSLVRWAIQQAVESYDARKGLPQSKRAS